MQGIKKYLLWLSIILLFVVVISFNFTKPFGFFRETNAALVCINANAWNSNNEIKQQGIPVSSYSFFTHNNPSDQLYSTTTTFGSAWFTVPYYFFEIFHLTPNPISIRLFSLCWLLITICTLLILTKTIIRAYNYQLIVLPLTVVLYLFAPATLWYHVQGYVHEIAVLPFYFLGWFCLVKFIDTQKQIWLWALATCIFMGVQFDWLPCFQAFTATIYLFINRKKINSTFSFIFPAIAIVAGLSYIVYHYSSWVNLTRYIGFMHSKFTARTVGGGGLKLISFLNHNFNILIFYAIGMGVLLLLVLFAFIKRKKLNPFILLIAITGILHHLAFWGFSTEHDHAAVKMLFPIAFIAATLLADLPTNKLNTALSIVIIVNIAQYFLLHNYPLRKGIYSNDNYCYEVGNNIKQISTDKDEIVFINTENKYYSQIEFYANKYYVHADNADAAKARLIKINKSHKGCFIEMNGSKVTNVIRFGF
jgi:hypothetical protein